MRKALAPALQALAAHPRLSALACGLVAALGFPPLGLWPLALCGMAGLAALLARTTGWRKAAGLGWLFGAAHFTFANNWIATAFTYQANMPVALGWVAVPLLALYLALITTGHAQEGDRLPLWVVLAAAGAISAGTYSGGWRIMRTMGRKIIDLDPARGFAAESVGASVLYTTAYVFEAPISTTHTITSAVMGVGATKRLSAVRWGVAKSILIAWVLTFPAAAFVAAVCYWVAALFLP